MKTRFTLALMMAVAIVAMVAGPALAATDSDRDGMPNRWERNHGLNPLLANAKGDADHDGLANVAEYRNQADPKDEDTDNDGADDRDEVRIFDTEPDDRDSDDDSRIDGHEDDDRDGTKNEDEDDLVEGCRGDDDDRDHDGIADEDENELRLGAGDADSDNDGVIDGDEDRDRDGVSNEDEDDDDEVGDNCAGDRDGDGERDEDDDDRLGTILSFDAATGLLEIQSVNGPIVSVTVGADTEIEFDDDSDGPELESDEASHADLVAGRGVAEVEFDEDTGLAEEIELIFA